MFLSTLVIAVWALATLGYIGLALYTRRQKRERERKIRELQRTVEKLKKKNGQLWYDMVKKNHGTGAFNKNELTITEF